MILAILGLALPSCADANQNQFIELRSPASSNAVYIEQLDEGFRLKSTPASGRQKAKIAGINQCNDVIVGWIDENTISIQGKFAYFTSLNYFEASRNDLILKICISSSNCPKLTNYYRLENCSQYELP